MELIKYVDLCSGIGGFRIALNNYSKYNKLFKFICVLSADIKQDAIDTYNLNFEENNVKIDINNLKPTDIPNFNLLCAGFPCQPFSSAGNKKGLNDKRSSIIFKIIDICKYHKPNIVILENVYNLLLLDKGECIKKIIKLFKDIGYNINYIKLNSKDFNCPQSRERVYIICSINKYIELNNILYNNSNILLKDIIDYDDKNTNINNNNNTFINKLLQIHNNSSIYGCKINDKRGGKNNIHSWELGYNGNITNEECKLMNMIMLERRKKHWATTKNIKWMDGMPLTFDEISTFYNNNNLQNMLNNLIEKKYLKIEKCKDLINNKRVYINNSKEGYNICKGKLSFPISKILDPNDITPTLTATDSHKLAIIIDNSIIRNLNCNELKKLSGFPDEFLIPSNVNYYDLFGNIVIPNVIFALLKLIY
jgi:DNA (cytosine-5)-methyltransferase 1